MIGLLVAGLVVFVVGLLAVGFGFPVKEFSFGNTLIITGVLGACTGLVLFALALVVRELKAISQALAASARRPHEVSDPFAAQSPAVAGATPAGAGAPPPSSPPPWQTEVGGRDRSRAPEPEPEPEVAAAPPVPEPAKKRRNLLFMSSKRDRAQEPVDPAQPDAVAPAKEMPALEPRGSFEDAWPASERTRSEPLRRTLRAPDTAETEDTRPAPPPAPPPLRRPAEAPPVTILKSGVVDGMAYSLYSDGSIEAQMPEGMIRFASIDELRQHLDQRGA